LTNRKIERFAENEVSARFLRRLPVTGIVTTAAACQQHAGELAICANEPE
jgi:hypothetical protein